MAEEFTENEIETPVETTETQVETPVIETPKTLSFEDYQRQTEARITLERENAELRSKIPKAEEKVTNEDPMPDPKDYEGREIDFTRDITGWHARQTARNEFARLKSGWESEQKTSSVEKRIKDAGDNYKSQIEAEIKADPKLETLLKQSTVALTDGRDFHLANSKYAGKIAAYFAKNPSELTEYATSPIEESLKILGGLERMFKTPSKTGSNAPAPHPTLEKPAADAGGKYKAGDGPQKFLDKFYPQN